MPSEPRNHPGLPFVSPVLVFGEAAEDFGGAAPRLLKGKTTWVLPRNGPPCTLELMPERKQRNRKTHLTPAQQQDPSEFKFAETPGPAASVPLSEEDPGDRQVWRCP